MWGNGKNYLKGKQMSKVPAIQTSYAAPARAIIQQIPFFVARGSSSLAQPPTPYPAQVRASPPTTVEQPS
ncbi:hypothetical protein O1611_g2620 [Lasiodiplodia mahajangana]|uniref:Uncharacterized protein n=1 Tax=Lasiodiplodia mahajangana TaxID=1108764 RepID=A0ACC2JU71_9PEZI|nr:hypothetical protein O1611_g2620 [Lasiodiplodia mahajangana]